MYEQNGLESNNLFMKYLGYIGHRRMMLHRRNRALR